MRSSKPKALCLICGKVTSVHTTLQHKQAIIAQASAARRA